MIVSRKAAGWAGVAVAACALALAPAIAASVKPAKQRAPAISLNAPGSLGSFTPAAANPKLAAAFNSAGLSGGGNAFRFTPASSATNRRGVTVAVRARAATKEEAQRTAATPSTSLTPTAYNLGVAVGWKRFALTGEVARVDGGVLPGRETFDVGVSYNAPKWSTKFQLGADRPTDVRSRLIGAEEAVSADLSGSYAVTRNLEVTGGVRYRLQRDRLLPIEDDRRDSQAVYIGTAFKF
ncbi:MAG: hypothetical protein ACREB5_03355 [Sphingomonadaceae bacterium]